MALHQSRTSTTDRTSKLLPFSGVFSAPAALLLTAAPPFVPLTAVLIGGPPSRPTKAQACVGRPAHLVQDIAKNELDRAVAHLVLSGIERLEIPHHSPDLKSRQSGGCCRQRRVCNAPRVTHGAPYRTAYEQADLRLVYKQSWHGRRR